MGSQELLEHLRVRACSRQWLGVVRAMGQEFSAELSDDELRALFGRIGRRFADNHSLGDCLTLQDVERAANDLWDRVEWGSCRFGEYPDRVEIEHLAPPINVALDLAPWADGFLQGVYQSWFQQSGMLSGLAVRTCTPRSEDVRCFVLSRVF
ncbi:hypothetical protein [Stenotrophomonas sp. MMGLT7]|uniref:cellulose biosynthesis protein BcsD n=1 Tax=Stenotrophomonas sp. MMGLT7 TaxID=2901227 RepID=UPI001E33A90E|nr:hypothetical protein [Stenotrophomonas sp. MMGLT7]MCD7099995.1 hypothetical protein [Stenotrophomonas sp. MMGLT7]